MTDAVDPTKGYKEDDEQNLNIFAYMFAGLAMMLNIRLSYSAAPYALLRFKLPENLFSVFVRTTSSALELWCLPSMLLGNIMEQVCIKTYSDPGVHATALKQKGGTNAQENGKLWQLANGLYEEANKLATAAKGDNAQDPEALKQKAGTSQETKGTLRYLARLLYEAANELKTAVGSAGDEGKASKLADEVGDTETTPSGKLRQALAQIHSAGGGTQLNILAGNVISAYGKVSGAFTEVQKQNVNNKYNTEPAKSKYQAVVAAWKAFDNVYHANLKGLANSLKAAIGPSTGPGGLQQALNNLSRASSTNNAKEVIINYGKVVDAYNAVTALGDTYKNIADTNSQYTGVETKFTELQKVYSEAIYSYKFHLITIPSIFTNWLNFLTFVILFIVYISGGDQGSVTGYYWVMAISGFVFGINMVLVYAVDYRYLPYYMAGENSFPAVTSAILYFATSIFGNRRKYNSDYVVVLIDISISIIIALVASVLWTVAFHSYRTPLGGGGNALWPELATPIAMVIVGMGLVYTIYPGIAPGMIVPFYLIDKIEMVLLVLTSIPPVIIAILRKTSPQPWHPMSPQCQWKEKAGQPWAPKNNLGDGSFWHLFDVLIPLKIFLAIIFIYSLHYRDSSIARSIINQPKMSTFLTIVFYMCHELLLAVGFPGMVGNGGAGAAIMLPTQYVGALLMVFLAFYSIGYITEYKRHDPSEWPTDGMTTWNALCYWLKMASKITNKNFKQLFTTD